MSTKSKTPKAPKVAKTKPEASAAKRTKSSTIDAGGGILVDVVEATPPAAPAPKSKKEPKAKKVSGLDLVAKVLNEKGEPMNAKDIAEAVIAAGWKTKGKTPASTLYSAMLREIDGKPGDSRFVKVGRGLFTLTKTKA